MKILKIYEQIMDFCGLSVVDDKVYVKTKDGKEPFLVDGKQLVIPTSNILRNFRSEEMIVFHPMSEDIIKGETSIITKLRYAINVRLNISTAILIQSLLNLVDSPEYHNKLTPEQTELLYVIKDLDDKTVKAFTSHMVKEVSEKEDRLFVSIYLKRAGTLGKEKYARVGVATFPFYHSLVTGEKYKFRSKDIEAFKAIQEFIFPDIANDQAYSYGSDSDVAPYFDALMISSYKIASRLNELISLYSDYIDKPDSITFDLEWYDGIKGMDNYKAEIRSIPVSSGLQAPSQEQAIPVVKQPTSYPVMQPQQPQQPMQPVAMQQMPMQQQAPVVKETARGIDFGSLKQAMGMPQQMPNAFAQPMMPVGYQQPRPYSGDILNRQQMPQMQPGMMPMQPGMMMQPGMYPMQGMPMQQMPQMQPGMVPMQPGMMMQQGMMPMQPGMVMQPMQPMPMQQPMMQQPGVWPN